MVTGVSWMVRPETAGFVGGGAWLVLLLLPTIGLRKAAELAAQQRYASARRLARALRFLHPAGDLRAQSELLRAMELAQRGDFASALALLGPLRNSHTNVGRQAIAQSFRIRGDWNGLLAWLRGELPPGTRQTDFALQPFICARSARPAPGTNFSSNSPGTRKAWAPRRNTSGFTMSVYCRCWPLAAAFKRFRISSKRGCANFRAT